MSTGDPKWGKSSEDRDESQEENSNGRGSEDRRNPPRRPTGGRGEEPPDLEEVWRDFNKKLGSLFGNARKTRGSGNWNQNNGGSPPGGMPPIQFNSRFAACLTCCVPALD